LPYNTFAIESYTILNYLVCLRYFESQLDDRKKVRMLIDYIFGGRIGKVLDCSELELSYSRRTKRLKHIFASGKLIATLRADGGLALTLEGGKLLTKDPVFVHNCVMVSDEAKSFVAAGKSVFARHVVRVGSRIKPEGDVVVIDKRGEILAVGKAVLSATMMRAFTRGVAVKVRQSIGKPVFVEKKA
jgi:uncharacterized protein with predicted RNA binding PUA domain